MMSANTPLPKLPSELDQKRQLVEQIVQHHQQTYRQRAGDTICALEELATQVDLTNPHLVRLMANSAYGIYHATTVLTDMTREELWTRLDLHEEPDTEAAADMIIDSLLKLSPIPEETVQFSARQASLSEKQNHEG